MIFVFPFVFCGMFLFRDGSGGVLWHYWFHCVFEMVVNCFLRTPVVPCSEKKGGGSD